ncbi:MAG: DNA polymerase III subunit delta' [Rudaea sp.]
MTLAAWNDEAWTRLLDRRRRGTLPHAILLCGEAGLGKREFADEFTRGLLCESVSESGFACGSCRGCRLLAAGSHPDLVRVSLEARDDGKLRSEILVDQMRALSERLALTAQFGRGQVALVDPADALNANAGNALLKTLEEPTPGTVIVLVADHPSRLPATIRSRCQRVDFRTPAHAVAIAWLDAQDTDGRGAEDALRAGDGNPGRALAWLRSGALRLRAEVCEDLCALIRGEVSALEIAQRWSRDDADLRLQFAATLAREQARAQAATRGGAGPFALTAAAELPKLTAWFDRANQIRELLRGPLRSDLALLELLAAWPAAVRNARHADAA